MTYFTPGSDMSENTVEMRDQEPVTGAAIRRVAWAAGIGTAIEWYDFFLFGTVAALVFPQVFFPNFSPLAGTLASFATFGAGFVARPLGGIVVGHFGDRVGRKKMLVLTVLIMGVATFLIGFAPTYDQIGIAAPVILVVLRLAQGFGVGGELSGATLMCVEHAPKNRRGFYGSWPLASAPIGLAVSTAVLIWLSATLNNEAFFSWGWRVPFLLSIVLVAVALYVRLKVEESPTFKQIQESNTRAMLPLADALRYYPGQILRAIGMYLAITVVFYVVTVFMISYATAQLGMDRTEVLLLVVASQPFCVGSALAAGAFSDRVGRRPVYVGFALLVAVLAFPAFALINQGSPLPFFIGITSIGMCQLGYGGVQGAFFTEMFETRVRYSAMSIGITVATLIGGAVTPSLATLLVAKQNGSAGVSLLIIFVALVAAISAFSAKETFDGEIDVRYERTRLPSDSRLKGF